MENLKEIANDLEKHLQNLDNIASNLIFDEICTFSLNEFNIPTTKFDNLKYSGLYLFEIKKNNENHLNWIENFENRFHNSKDEKDYFRYKFTPRVIKTRLRSMKHTDSEWIPLYLGKAIDINRRINEHIFSQFNKSPFALKLYHRFEKEIFIDDTFRLKTIALDLTEKQYGIIAPYIEKKLREELKPIVGRQ